MSIFSKLKPKNWRKGYQGGIGHQLRMDWLDEAMQIPEAPTPPIPPAGPPTIDEARLARDRMDVLRRRRGRASTILTGPSGANNPNIATSILLGG